MNLTHIPRRVEIVFWIVLINLMKESPLAQSVIQSFFLYLEKLNRNAYLLLAIAGASAGLGLGFFLGLWVIRLF